MLRVVCCVCCVCHVLVLHTKPGVTLLLPLLLSEGNTSHRKHDFENTKVKFMRSVVDHVDWFNRTKRKLENSRPAGLVRDWSRRATTWITRKLKVCVCVCVCVYLCFLCVSISMCYVNMDFSY